MPHLGWLLSHCGLRPKLEHFHKATKCFFPLHGLSPYRWGSILYLPPAACLYGKFPQLQRFLEKEMHSFSLLLLSGLPAWQDAGVQKCSMGYAEPLWLQVRQNVHRKVDLDPTAGLCPEPIAMMKIFPHVMHCSSPCNFLAKLTQPVLFQEVEFPCSLTEKSFGNPSMSFNTTDVLRSFKGAMMHLYAMLIHVFS